MKNILFSAGVRQQYSGTKTELINLHNIDVKNAPKDRLPYIQNFNCNYRQGTRLDGTEYIDISKWNGIVTLDIDSKYYYNNVKHFNPVVLFNMLYDYFCYQYTHNFYAIQASNSGLGYHIWMYFDVERTEENFKKCAFWCREAVIAAFDSFGAGDIIRYKKVLDTCTNSILQGIYLTSNEIRFGFEDIQHFGHFDLSEIEVVEKQYISKDINEDGTLNFEYKKRNDSNKKFQYPHILRWMIYNTLITIFGNKETVDSEWEYICHNLVEYNGHTTKFYINEPKRNHWYERYDSKFIVLDILKNFGYEFDRLFQPTEISMYEPDEEYNLEFNEYLSDIDINFDKDRINHIFAGCGFGKTYWAEKLGKDNRVLFISPLTSINKDAFSDKNGWLIIDKNEKDTAKYITGSIKNALTSNWNICTTWESFVLYEMYNHKFDYVIVDEIHTLYMYDYRIESISKMKRYLPIANGIKIVMTGTPSLEVNEFDCKKIKINKKQSKVNADIVFYHKQFNGYIYKDIKEWIKDPNHYAIIFKDTANYKDEDKMILEGIKIDVFNTNYKDTVEYILNENNVKEQVTIFSVYGQAGINLYIDTDKKMRIYVLNKNGLALIQYANRVRNKSVIDKVVIPYKKDKVSNDVVAVDTDYSSDIIEARRRVEVLNYIKKDFDIFDIKNTSILKLRYGFSTECIDKIDGKLCLNETNYTTYCAINRVNNYENQIQVIYNRLMQNDFNVNCMYLKQDVKTNKATKLRSNQLAGQIAKFDFDMIKETRGGLLWLKPNEAFNKVLTGNLKEELEYIFNRIYDLNFHNFNAMKQNFVNLINDLLIRKETIIKKDIDNIYTLLKLQQNWNSYYNNAFIVAMLDENWTDTKLAAAYMRSIYDERMTKEDIENLSEETYQKIHNIRNVVEEYHSIFENMDKNCDPIEIKNDEITHKIYSYIESNHNKKNNTKSVVIDGIKYNSVTEAAKMLGISKQALYKRLKR